MNISEKILIILIVITYYVLCLLIIFGIFGYIYRFRRYSNDGVKLSLMNVLTEFLSSLGLTNRLCEDSLCILCNTKKQTRDLCLDEVTKNGMLLRCVRDQTYEICYAAVSNNGMALKYVKNQTFEICNKAICNNKNAIKYIKTDLIYKIMIQKI